MGLPRGGFRATVRAQTQIRGPYNDGEKTGIQIDVSDHVEEAALVPLPGVGIRNTPKTDKSSRGYDARFKEVSLSDSRMFP